MSDTTKNETTPATAAETSAQQGELSEETLEAVSGGIIGPDGCIPRPPGFPPPTFPRPTDPTFIA